MQRGRTSSHRFGHSCEFVDCFAFSRQSDECRCYLCVGGSSIKQCIEKIRGFSARQIFSAHKSHRHLAKIDIAGFIYYRLQVHRIFISLAIASAFIMACALMTVSSYSCCGSESATIPAPAWKYAF